MTKIDHENHEKHILLARNDQENLKNCQENQDFYKKIYRENIDLMLHYSDSHDENVLLIDSEIEDFISEMTTSIDHKLVLLNMWREETITNEEISKQLWIKRRNFLIRKKKEEEESGDYMTRDEKSEDIKVKIRGKRKSQSSVGNHKSTNRRSGPVSRNQHQLPYYTWK